MYQPLMLQSLALQPLFGINVPIQYRDVYPIGHVQKLGVPPIPLRGVTQFQGIAHVTLLKQTGSRPLSVLLPLAPAEVVLPLGVLVVVIGLDNVERKFSKNKNFKNYFLYFQQCLDHLQNPFPTLYTPTNFRANIFLNARALIFIPVEEISGTKPSQSARFSICCGCFNSYHSES